MGENETVIVAIDRLVIRHATAGKVVDVPRAAEAISITHPDCDLTLEELAQRIEESAVRNRAVLLSGPIRR
jgi:hypothetical protein